jgi:hypothetical protein
LKVESGKHLCWRTASEGHTEATSTEKPHVGGGEAAGIAYCGGIARIPPLRAPARHRRPRKCRVTLAGMTDKEKAPV